MTEKEMKESYEEISKISKEIIDMIKPKEVLIIERDYLYISHESDLELFNRATKNKPDVFIKNKQIYIEETLALHTIDVYNILKTCSLLNYKYTFVRGLEEVLIYENKIK